MGSPIRATFGEPIRAGNRATKADQSEIQYRKAGKRKTNETRKMKNHRNFRTAAGCWLVLAVLVACAAAAICLKRGTMPRHSASSQPVTSLAQLLSLPPERLAHVQIARMNLLCATGLGRTAEPETEQLLAVLQAWAERIRSETDRHWYRFRRNPAEFENSEGFFRMLMLTVVLAEDFGVHYNAAYRMDPDAARTDDGFFGDPRQVFLPGILGPERVGTCSSFPVLYVAVGRQLGYPLKLVATKGHLFVRWDGAGERFNVESTARGLCRFSDDYYRHWPFEVSPDQVAAEGYLKSLTPPEELAVFLSIRGMCLREAGRLSEAADSFAAAAKLAPNCRGHRQMLASCRPSSPPNPTTKEFSRASSTSTNHRKISL